MPVLHLASQYKQEARFTLAGGMYLKPCNNKEKVKMNLIFRQDEHYFLSKPPTSLRCQTDPEPEASLSSLS